MLSYALQISTDMLKRKKIKNHLFIVPLITQHTTVCNVYLIKIFLYQIVTSITWHRIVLKLCTTLGQLRVRVNSDVLLTLILSVCVVKIMTKSEQNRILPFQRLHINIALPASLTFTIQGRKDLAFK